MKTNQTLCCRLCAAFVGATALLWTACEREVDFTGLLPDAVIVINGFAEAGQPVAVRVTRSWNLAEEAGDYTLRDAAVSLYINGALRPPMRFDADARPPQYTSESVARAGDRVRIVVRKDGYPEAAAETVVPAAAAPILSVDTVRFVNRNSTESMRFLIRIRDLAAGQEDYCRLIVERLPVGNGDARQSEYVAFDYDQDAALNESFRSSSGELLTDDPANTYGIFTDGLFDGGEYTLNIHFPLLLPDPVEPGQPRELPDAGAGQSAHGAVRQVRYIFKLATLSPSAYLYLKSRTLYDNYGEDGYLFTEPAAIYTNVEGGLGILGAFGTDTAGVDIPLRENENFEY
ncbi:MAG: DUF4249 domain-containing protein [Tannerella sp.]|jgi:hypothetical protein|nr:DUF4249 domain-containing protein [Tannerella sp.]